MYPGAHHSTLGPLGTKSRDISGTNEQAGGRSHSETYQKSSSRKRPHQTLGAESTCQCGPPCRLLSKGARRTNRWGFEIKSPLSQGPRAQSIYVRHQIPRARTMASAALGRLEGDADEQTRREGAPGSKRPSSVSSAGYRLGCFLFLFTPQWERKAVIPKIFRRRMSTSTSLNVKSWIAIKYRI